MLNCCFLVQVSQVLDIISKLVKVKIEIKKQKAILKIDFKCQFTFFFLAQLIFYFILLGDKPFEFTALLHTYYKVNSIDTMKIQGLKGCCFIDKVKLSIGETVTTVEVLIM